MTDDECRGAAADDGEIDEDEYGMVNDDDDDDDDDGGGGYDDDTKVSQESTSLNYYLTQ